MRIKKITQKALLTHLFFVSFFMIVPTLAFVRLPGESIFTFTRIIIQDTLANFILLCFFYVNYYILIPKFYFNHKYFLYILFVVLFLSLTFPLPHLIGKFMPDSDNTLPPFIPPSANGLHPQMPDLHSPLFFFSFDEFRRHLYLFFTAIFFSFLLRTREHLAQLKEEKLQAELSSLKAQINPHFLFNTLNNIYTLSLKKDARASDAIIHLAGIMRYAISDANDAKIPLEKEIDYINNYIELQKSRLGDTAFIGFECSGKPGNKSIAPLILITYIENAFKYGISPDADDCIVQILVHITDKGVQLQTFNKKVQLSGNHESTGIGMRNTGDRLQHLYANKHNLDITENKESYSVTLSIDLE